MPEISRFYGITITMYYLDHLPPHIHARYSGWDGSVSIESGELLDGALPGRALSLVSEWALLHQVELRADWERARRREPLLQISPLP